MLSDADRAVFLAEYGSFRYSWAMLKNAIRLTNAPESELLYAGGELGLRQQLECSWIYPKDFFLEYVRETEDALQVHGRSEVYSFQKRESSELTLNQLWARAVLELPLVEQFAPDYCLGLQPYMIDEELFWLWDAPRLTDLDLPLEADGFAVVHRRLPQARSLVQLVQQKPLSRRRLREPVNRLRLLHLAAEPLSAADWQRTLERRFGEKLSLLTQGLGSFLDPFSRLLIAELQAFLRRHVERHEHALIERARNGCVRELHGNLAMSGILQDAGHCWFLRPQLDAGLRPVGDVLSDLTSLCVDARLSGYDGAAEIFEKEYFRLAPQAADAEQLRFFTAESALVRACRLFGRFEAGGADDLVHEATRALALGLRTVHHLDGPFIVCICGQKTPSHGLSQALSELCGADYLGPELVQQSLPNLPQDRAFVFERLLSRVEQNALRRRAVVFDWPACSDFEQQQLLHVFSDLEVPFLFVGTDRGTKISARNLEQGRYFLWVEDGMPQEELALFVVRELSRRMRYDRTDNAACN